MNNFLESNKPAKEFVESYNNIWTKDIFSKRSVKGLVAIFYNKDTNTTFASVVYTEKMIGDFIEETIRESRGKLEYIEVISEKEFDRNYIRAKELPKIGLDIIISKKTESYNFIVDNMCGKKIRIPANILKIARMGIQDILRPTYFTDIPLDKLFTYLNQLSIKVISEDGTEWQGILLGDDSQAYFDLAYYDDVQQKYKCVSNSMLALQWHRMSSDKWEVVGYLT